MFDLGASRSNDCVCTSSCQLSKKILRQARPTATVSSMAHGSWAADYAPAPIHQVIAQAGSGFTAVAVIEFDRVVPPDSLHEDIDITRRRGTVVHVIGVLVHVEHDNRPPARECRGVVGSPLIDQPLVSRRIGEDHPSGSTGLRLAHGGEFGAPAIDAAEVPRNGLGQSAARPAATAPTVEIDFVP